MARKEGSLSGEMRIRVNAHCASKGNKTKRNYKKACEKFDTWRKGEGISNREVRDDRRGMVERWRDALLENYAVSTVHTYIAGVCCGLGILWMTLSVTVQPKTRPRAWGIQFAPG